MNLPVLDGIIVMVLLAGLVGAGYWARRLMRSVASFTVAGQRSRVQPERRALSIRMSSPLYCRRGHSVKL